MSGSTLETARQVYSVSDLTRNVRLLIEQHFASIWVEGELTNFKRHTSGHLYFSLKDETAQIQCVMFRRENLALRFEIEEGLRVVCLGRISVYALRGQYQLYIDRIEPKGLGELQLRFEQLKKKLAGEGLFDPDRKKELPFLPRRIALVTSVDGAALHDMLRVIDRRCPNVNVLIYPVPVQGPGAAERIAEALDDLNSLGDVDVIVVARGGGSLEDLWAFNEESVARAIFRSEVPVVSAVGHETDFTIADFAADLRAATPSVAAELVLPVANDLRLQIGELKESLLHAMRVGLRDRRQELKALTERQGLKNPLAVFERLFQRLDELTRGLAREFAAAVERKREKAAGLVGKLEALGPLSTLKRGFSVTLKVPGERIVASVSGLKRGDRVRTRVADGSFISEITEVHP